MRVRYEAHLDHRHYGHIIEAHRMHGTGLEGRGFGKWLRKTASTVGHAIQHSKIASDLVESGAKALGDSFLGPGGGQVAGNLAHSLLQSGAHPSPAAAPARAPAPPRAQQPAPVSHPTAAGGGGGVASDEAGFGVRRRPAKKRAPAKRKRAVKRPF